ncbi:MAG TPA: hypothetical protein VGK20_04610 [Candidatus Binatia bacterium]
MSDALERGIARQHAELARRLTAGMPRAGWKICINDLRMQKRLGLTSSFPGFLNGALQLDDGGEWVVGETSVPAVEPEIALRFGRAIAPGADHRAIRAAIAGAAPALELVDWKDAKLDLESLAASSSFHAGFVVGSLAPLETVPAIGDGCPRFVKGDEIAGIPDPSLVPSDLVGLVASVVAFLAPRGHAIAAGDWLICGACTNPARVEAGDLVTADFGSPGAVSIRVRRNS